MQKSDSELHAYTTFLLALPYLESAATATATAKAPAAAAATTKAAATAAAAEAAAPAPAAIPATEPTAAAAPATAEAAAAAAPTVPTAEAAATAPAAAPAAGSWGTLGFGQEAIDRQQFHGVDKELVAVLIGRGDDALGHLDGEHGGVDGAENLVDFADERLVLEVDRRVEIGNLGGGGEVFFNICYHKECKDPLFWNSKRLVKDVRVRVHEHNNSTSFFHTQKALPLPHLLIRQLADGLSLTGVLEQTGLHDLGGRALGLPAPASAPATSKSTATASESATSAPASSVPTASESTTSTERSTAC